jgi:sugar O-acyltransferase (sialic acid O-acetyltransferase NeuD family)
MAIEFQAIKLQIIGKGGFAREVAAYADNARVPYRMYENECKGIIPGIGAVIAIGDVSIRQKVAEQFKHIYFCQFDVGMCYSHNNSIGAGAIICPGSILTVNVRLGVHCLINLNCTIGHDCIIGDFVTISPGANISGNVIIGDMCYIGSNAVIRDKITICSDVTIGAGGVVVKDITEPGVYVGNPVKKIG